jgi:hypothetical protein
MPIICILRYNGRLDIRVIVSLTTAKYKSHIFCVWLYLVLCHEHVRHTHLSSLLVYSLNVLMNFNREITNSVWSWRIKICHICKEIGYTFRFRTVLKLLQSSFQWHYRQLAARSARDLQTLTGRYVAFFHVNFSPLIPLFLLCPLPFPLLPPVSSSSSFCWVLNLFQGIMRWGVDFGRDEFSFLRALTGRTQRSKNERSTPAHF